MRETVRRRYEAMARSGEIVPDATQGALADTLDSLVASLSGDRRKAGVGPLAPAHAQLSESELVMRLNRLETQVRQLTGIVEQLQHRNQQLEQQLTRAPQAAPPAQPRGPVLPPPQAAAPPPRAHPPQDAYPPGPPPTGGRRGDAFDPNQHPNAPGIPRTLGSPGSVAAAPPLDNQASDELPVGAPGGRQAGAPLDLGIMAEEAANSPPPRREVRQIPGALPSPSQRNPSGSGTQMVMAPSNTPKDEYDLAYGYVLRKDYPLAEEALRAFMKK